MDWIGFSLADPAIGFPTIGLGLVFLRVGIGFFSIARKAIEIAVSERLAFSQSRLVFSQSRLVFLNPDMDWIGFFLADPARAIGFFSIAIDFFPIAIGFFLNRPKAIEIAVSERLVFSQSRIILSQSPIEDWFWIGFLITLWKWAQFRPKMGPFLPGNGVGNGPIFARKWRGKWAHLWSEMAWEMGPFFLPK